jgi:hypothetical protein
VIEVLHFSGAEQGFIASLFQNRFAAMAGGGLAGRRGRGHHRRGRALSSAAARGSRRFCRWPGSISLSPCPARWSRP